MAHKTKEFIFFDKEGNEIKLISKRYNKNVEELIEKRIPNEVLDEFAKTNKLSINIRFADAEEDLPQLLEGEGIQKVDWGYDYDAILEPYLFFIQYKQNAVLKHIQLDAEMLASNLETLKKIMSSIPETTLQNPKRKTSKST